MTKLCIIGGGGVRMPFVAKSIALKASRLGINEIVFFDNSEEKMKIYGDLARRIAIKISPGLDIALSTNARDSLRNADYIICAVRPGGDLSRVNDEKVVAKYNLLAQETTGACGFSMAMRSIPTLIEYCELAKEVSKPNHRIFNFTNPAGIVTQALADRGFPVIGICDSPSELIKQIRKLFEISEERFSCNVFGLNHLSWFNNFKIDGKPSSKQVLAHTELFSKTEMRIFDPKILNISEDHLLNEYLYFYYYNRKAISNIEKAKQTRGALIQSVNERMAKELEEVDIEKEFDEYIRIYFDNYSIRENSYFQDESGSARVKRFEAPTADQFVTRDDEAGYAGVALQIIEALQNDQSTSMVLSVPNNGAIESLVKNDIIEVMCRVDKSGVHPNKQGEIPASILNLILSMKEYERTAVKAILSCEGSAAVKALTINPLVANFDIAQEIFDRFLELNKEFCGVWT